jgi:4-hydroxybenzoate polyprenyltransferase
VTIASLSRLVKFEHSLFALPFAASTVVLVSRSTRLEAWRLALVVAAIVAARTAAMAMNRIADRRWDAVNPRTWRRELVTGEVSIGAAWALLVGSSTLFLAVAWVIRPICGLLAPVVLAVLLSYSYGKRFTWAVHLWLGVAQSLGPLGVAIALTGTISPAVVLLGVGVGSWIAGFDVFYSLQDQEFDRSQGLCSVPTRFGVKGALVWARGLHLVTAVCVAAAGPLAGRGAGWSVGAALLAAVLLAEHLYVAPGGQLRPERIGKAFFDFNAFASVVFAACALADLAFHTSGLFLP